MRAVPCAHFGFDSADAGAGELEARGLQYYTVGIRKSGNVGNLHVNQLREGGCGKHDVSLCCRAASAVNQQTFTVSESSCGSC